MSFEVWFALLEGRCQGGSRFLEWFVWGVVGGLCSVLLLLVGCCVDVACWVGGGCVCLHL